MDIFGLDADSGTGGNGSQGTVVYNITQSGGNDENRLDEIENKNDEQDVRLTALESTPDSGGDPLVDGLQNSRLDALETGQITQNNQLTEGSNKDIEQDSRLDELEIDVNELQSNVGAIELKDQEQDSRIDAIETLNTEQDGRLDQLRTATLENENIISELDLQADLADDKNIQQDGRLDSLETSDTAQNSRLDSIEAAQGGDGKTNLFNYSGQPILDTEANVLDPLFGFTGQGGGRESGGNDALWTLGFGGEVAAVKAGVGGALSVIGTNAVKLTYFRVNRSTTLQSIFTSLRCELKLDVNLLPVQVDNAQTFRIIVGVKHIAASEDNVPPTLDDLLAVQGSGTLPYADFDIQTETTYSPYDGTVLDATGSTLLSNSVGIVTTVGSLLGTLLNDGEASISSNLETQAEPPPLVAAGDFILTGVRLIVPQDFLAGVNLKVAMNASACVEYI